MTAPKSAAERAAERTREEEAALESLIVSSAEYLPGPRRALAIRVMGRAAAALYAVERAELVEAARGQRAGVEGEARTLATEARGLFARLAGGGDAIVGGL